jgi:predicted nuclease with TOPRIM domain
MEHPHKATMPDHQAARNCPPLPDLQFDSRSIALFNERTTTLESNHNKERKKIMSEVETLNERLEDLERRLSQMHHPCMTRVDDLQGVIIRLTNEKVRMLELKLANMKKTTTSTTPLDIVASKVEFGHLHE